MSKLTILNPHDQPTGKWRLLNDLRECLKRADFDRLLIAVAFAKTGPLYRLQTEIESWRRAKKRIDAIFGINHQGTSKQALEFAMAKFSSTRLLYYGERLTFHPKMYLFIGPKHCRFYLGSHNLTVGGTETNWESGTVIDLVTPVDDALKADTLSVWQSLVDVSIKMTPTVFNYHERAGDLLDETKLPPRRGGGTGKTGGRAAASGITRPKIVIKPPSPLPPSLFRGQTAAAAAPATAASPIAATPTVPAEALVIQIVPHKNGEVFLSKIAVNQNPGFFGFPFTGRTVPKKAHNPSYPQRTPDPIINLTVYDATDTPVVRLPRLGLNTVFYDSKSEIRITVPPEVVRNTPPYSILVMRQAAPNEDYDYDMDIFPPTNPQFANYLSICNQTMPSGGKPTPRKMGWL